MSRRGDEDRPRGRKRPAGSSREPGPSPEDELLRDTEEADLFPGPAQLDHDDLLAESEYNVRMAGGERLHLADGNRWLGVHEEEELSVDPEEIGRRTLEEATQDFHPRIEDEELPDAEWPRDRWAERHLVTRLPERGDEENHIAGRAAREPSSRRRGPARGRHRRSPR